MRLSTAVLLALTVLSSSLFNSRQLDAQESKLARLLQQAPATPNSMVYIHVPSLKKLIQEEDMDADIPAHVDEVWLMADVDTISLQPQWEVGYSTSSYPVPVVDELARTVGGYVDQIGDSKFVWSPNETYLAPIEKGIAFIRPAERPLLAKILGGQTVPAPEYLAKESKQPESFLSFMVGMNLKNLFSPYIIEKRLANYELLKSMNLTEVSQILGSVEGYTVIIGRKSLKECILTFTFDKDPSSLKPVASQLLSDLLTNYGTPAKEVEQWDAYVEGNKLAFKGPIAEQTLHGLLSIFTFHAHAGDVHSDVPAKERLTVEVSPAQASKQYFDMVNKHIERARKYDAQSTGYRAKWNDLTARRIDEISTKGVDKEMIQYGANVSAMLRGNSTAIRGVNQQAGQQQVQAGLQNGYEYGYGGYNGVYNAGGYGYRQGYYNPNSAADYQMAIGTQAAAAGFTSFKNILSQIDQMTGDIRRRMTEKYDYAF